jgi:4-nitrophenyl phosphatase
MDLIEKYDYFLFDCDGVLWNGKLEIENAFIALRLILSHKNKKVFFITNNSTRERKTV